jgi:hypothetical protein
MAERCCDVVHQLSNCTHAAAIENARLVGMHPPSWCGNCGAHFAGGQWYATALAELAQSIEQEAAEAAAVAARAARGPGHG